MAVGGWRKSSFSSLNNCVEVRLTDDGALMRDSKDRDGAVLRFSPAEWAAFIGGAKAGEFDLPAGSAPV